jgi:hypothetical protein
MVTEPYLSSLRPTHAVKTRFDLELRLQAATEVFGALQAEQRARRAAALFRVRMDAAVVQILDVRIDDPVQGHTRVGCRSATGGKNQRGSANAMIDKTHACLLFLYPPLADLIAQSCCGASPGRVLRPEFRRTAKWNDRANFSQLAE